MFAWRHWNGQCAYWAEVPLRLLVSLSVQPLVLELGRALLAGLLVLLAMGLLAVHTAIFDEEAGRAVLELDSVATSLCAVGAHISGCCRRRDATRCHVAASLCMGDGSDGSDGQSTSCCCVRCQYVSVGPSCKLVRNVRAVACGVCPREEERSVRGVAVGLWYALALSSS